jgi:oligosaccharide repeat unit polymerase
MSNLSSVKYLFFIPSFYGFITMSITYLIFLFDIIDYNPISLTTHFFVIISIFSFLISTIVFYELNKILFKSYNVKKVVFQRRVVVSLYFVSFLGVYLYLNQYFSAYGGYLNYFLILFSDSSSELRANSLIASESIGIQLTYFGWIAIGITFFHIVKNEISKFWWIPIIITFFSNLLFIDRTRPIWILLIILYIYLCIFQTRIKFFVLVKRISYLIFFFFTLFILIGSIAGKTTDEKLYKGWDVSPNVQNIVFYLTSSYLYLDYIICNENPNYEFDRTINPALKIFKILGVVDNEPSSLINEFHGQPYQTNVGSFLEPFFRDFGYLYMIFGIILHAFFLNFVAIFFLKQRDPYSLFLVSNICIIDLFSFFTPKLNNFPIWLFLFLGVLLFFKKISVKIV